MRGTIVRQIGEERADLLRALQRATDDDWNASTACAPWTVKDVLAHLVEGELGAGRVYRSEVRETGYVDPEIGIAKWSALPGVAVRAALWQHGTATQRALDAMTEETWRAPVRTMGCDTVGRLVRLHLFDLAVHGHDLTDAIGAEPVWAPRLPFLAEYVVRAAAKTMMRRAVPPDGELGVVAGDLRATLAARDGAWQVSLGEAAAPTTVELEPEDLVLITTGRAPIPQTLERAKVGGDRAEAERIFSGWQVVGR